MINSNLQLCADRFSDRKVGHPNQPAAQTILGTIIGDSIMKRIKLTQGKFATVDDTDYEWLNQWKWCAVKGGHTFYVHTYNKIGTKSKLQMHRIIMDAKTGQQIDHRNGNGLDNKRENLRFSTQSQNCMNQKPKGNTSKFKGVSWHKINKKWRAMICEPNTGGRSRHIGCYDSEVDAGKAYDRAAIKYFGEFARLNFSK